MSTDATAIATPTGVHHVRLTITDIGRSKQFYQQLLGADPEADFSDQDDPAVREDPDRLYGGCIFSIGEQILGLRPVAPSTDRFDSTRVGLDHVSLRVNSVQDLTDAAARLDAAGIGHGEVKTLDAFGLAILSIQDPDDINLELVANLSESDG